MLLEGNDRRLPGLVACLGRALDRKPVNPQAVGCPWQALVTTTVAIEFVERGGRREKSWLQVLGIGPLADADAPPDASGGGSDDGQDVDAEGSKEVG